MFRAFIASVLLLVFGAGCWGHHHRHRDDGHWRDRHHNHHRYDRGHHHGHHGHHRW